MGPERGSLRAVTPANGYHYLVAQPTGHSGEPAKRWPLLLFLHGAGERGHDVRDVMRQGAPKLLDPAAELTPSEEAAARDLSAGFILVAPQCPHFEVWDEPLLLALLDRAGSSLPIDPARVSVAGLSMGGFGAWSLAMRHPQRFAALVAICGGGRVADVHAARQKHPAALQRMGIWAFHGERDVVVPLEESRRMVAAAKEAGVRDVRFTVYPGVEHDAWTETFANREVYAWLLRHAQ